MDFDPLDTMSPTKVEMLARCGFAFKQRYILGIKTPPSAALAFGSSYDDALNGSLVQKQTCGSDPIPEEVADRFAASWDARASEVEDWRDEDRGVLLDQGTAVSRLWAKQLAPRISPLLVQGKIEIPVRPDGFTIVGFFDALATVDGEQVVVDHKTSARAWAARRTLTSTQPGVYVGGARQDGHDVRSMQWHVAVRGSKPSAQVLTRSVDDAEVRGTVRKFAAARRLAKAMAEQDAFLPNRENIFCSRRWCAYWNDCEKEFGGTVPE